MLPFDYYASNLFFVPFIPVMNEKPPTVYSILESIVNYGKTDKTTHEYATKLKGNQFVWIPCTKDEYKKINFGMILTIH